MLNNPIATVIADRVPGFIRNEFPNFHKFIADFYTWLETDENYVKALIEHGKSQEVNRHIEPQIDFILREIGWDYSADLAIEKKLLVHSLREFYLSRGSANSFKYLFRVLYGKDVDVSFPKERMFYASNADFSNDYWIVTTANNYGTEEFKLAVENVTALAVVVRGLRSNIEINADKVIPVIYDGDHYLRILVNDNKQDFTPLETVEISSVDGSILETVITATYLSIDNPGILYMPGDEIVIQNSIVAGLAKVRTTYRGGINNVAITDGGSDYAVGDSIRAVSYSTGSGFFAAVDEVDGGGAITAIKIWSQGYEYEIIPTLIINSGTGTGAVLAPSSATIGGIKSVEFVDDYWGVDNTSTASVTSDLGTGAVITVLDNKCINNHHSTHKNQRGFLGSNCVITDSLYFQEFSYELRSEVSLSIYDSITNKLVHPAGSIKYAVYDNETVTPFGDFAVYHYLVNTIYIGEFDEQFGPITSAFEMNVIQHIKDEIDRDFLNIAALDTIKFADLFIEPISTFADQTLADRDKYIHQTLETSIEQT